MTENDAIAILGKIAQELTGVQFNARHREMIKSRLQKRLIDLQLRSLDEYLNYFNEHREDESKHLVSLLTTHHTYFFREFSHFEYLRSHALPALCEETLQRQDKTLRIWSAACSRGQEVYSLAMFLSLHLKQIHPDLKFQIDGSDVDPESIKIAKNAVYLRDELKEVPLALMGNHWIRGTGEIANYAKARSSLRQHCHFRTESILKLPSSSLLYDIIFCRNVFIYFTPAQIQEITKSLLKRLQTNGYLFVGVSESLSQSGLPISILGHSIYQHKSENKKPSKRHLAITPQPTPIVEKPVSTGPLRVLCVDDSPVVLSLLKKILSSDNTFEVVGTAANGLEAQKQVQALKPDVMTLDIHMPEMDGVSYLRSNLSPTHPPVVMVTSVSREDFELAGTALSLGAMDYVEKPAMTGLVERGEEIRTKLKCAFLAKRESRRPSLALDHSFQQGQPISNPENKTRIIVGSMSQRRSLKQLIAEMKGQQPPCVILVEGAGAALSANAQILSKEFGKAVQSADAVPAKLELNQIWLLDLKTSAKALSQQTSGKDCSILVFGEITQVSAIQLTQFLGAQIILEDLGEGKGARHLMEIAKDVVLPTSFLYLSNEFFSQMEKKKVA